MPDIFYREFDANSPITSGAQYLAAAAGRIAKSILWSFPKLPRAGYEHLKSLVNVNTLWSLCIVIAAWVLATIVGGPVALALNGLLIAWGLYELWEQVKDSLNELKLWAYFAWNSRNEKELEVASQHFATFLAGGGLTVLELLVTHRLFRLAEVKIQERFKPPDWLSREYEAQVRARELREQEKKATGKDKAPARPVERAVELAKRTASGARLRGMEHAANEFPTGAVVVGGVLVVLTASATMVWALNREEKK